MSYIVSKEIPNRCGRCPCFHAEHPMYCQAVKADKNKRIYAPYGEGRPEWCPLIEIKTPHGRLIDADAIDYRNDAMHDSTGHLVVANDFITGILWLIDCIERTPTIIEAEGK